MAAAVQAAAPATLRLAVCGLHLRGQPLNSQLTDLGARFVESCRSMNPGPPCDYPGIYGRVAFWYGQAPCYRLYALGPPAVSAPRKPGMVRVTSGGASVVLETFDLPLTSLGAFINKVPPPLTIGSLQLEDGSTVKGFLAESYIVEAGEGVEDITHIGGWVVHNNNSA